MKQKVPLLKPVVPLGHSFLPQTVQPPEAILDDEEEEEEDIISESPSPESMDVVQVSSHDVSLVT